jgi:hypothetical protein
MRIIKGSTNFVGFEITYYKFDRSLSMTFWKWYLIFEFGAK